MMDNWFEEWFNWISIAIAGAIGGTMAVIKTKRRFRWLVTFVGAVTGALVAAFGVPLLVEYFGVMNHRVHTGIAFFLGIMSSPIIEKLANIDFDQILETLKLKK